MQIGDLVKTKCPGFGTGSTPRLGVIVEHLHPGAGKFHVLETDGHTRPWYDWQLEIINEDG